MKSRLRGFWQLRRHRGIVAVVMAVVLLAGTAAGWAVPRLAHVSHAAMPTAPDTVGMVVPASGTNLYYLRYANAPGYANKQIAFGTSSMIPIAGDWDGHGVSTIGAFDPSQAEFWLSDFNENGGPPTHGFFFGSPGDIPIVGHWNNKNTPLAGYNEDVVGVFHPATSTFSLAACSSPLCPAPGLLQSVTFGVSGDIPIAGDWTGTGFDSIGVYDPATGFFYLDTTPHSGYADYTVAFGPPGAIPITGDWRGSGHTGIGVVYHGVVYLKNDPLTSGYADAAFACGPSGATPITGHFIAPNALPVTAWTPCVTCADTSIHNRLTEGPDGAIWMTVNAPPFRTFPASGYIVRLAPVAGLPVYIDGNSTTYTPPQHLDATTRIASGPDGNLWFGDNGSGYIGKITTGGTFTLYTPPHGVDFEGAAAGSDGALWYTVKDADKILKVTTSGGFTEYPIPTANSQPTAITAGPDGALWFTEYGAGKIGRITTGGSISEYVASATAGYTQVDNIVSGPDGNLWYSLTNSGSSTPGHLVKMNTAGVVQSEYAVSSDSVADVTVGPDGNLWFLCAYDAGLRGQIVGKVTMSGSPTLYSPPSIFNFAYEVSSNGIASGPNANIWLVFAEYDLH